VIVTLLSHTLKGEVIEELTAVLSGITARRLVITGTNGYFAAGADIQELQALNARQAFEFSCRGQQLMNALGNHSAETIAAIDGYCMGGGLDLALACNLRYATSKSVLAHPGGRIGIMTGWGGTQRLPQIIGKARTLEMMVVGRRLSAEQAAEWGLIDAVVTDPVEYGLEMVAER
jgi:enoyl-CoA hydratase/carnithine racemase